MLKLLSTWQELKAETEIPFIGQFLHPSSLNDDIKSVWVVLLEFLPLRLWVLPIELDVFISRFQILRNIHFDALVSSNDDSRSAVQLEELGEDETSWASAEEEDCKLKFNVCFTSRGDWKHVVTFNSNRWVQFVQPMNGTRSRLQEGGFLVGEVVDFVQLLLLTSQGE
jgi:hypothetical protein